MNAPVVRGAGGGGGGGSSPPTIKPDNLLSDDLVEFALGICEGPIAGLVNGPRSFYLDDTPLVNANGENNFNPFELHVYHGEADATPISYALGGITSNSQVGVSLATDTPVVRQTDASLRNKIDQLEVRVVINTLVKSTNKGDQLEDTIEFKIEFRQVGDTSWQGVYDDGVVALTGKTTSGYTRDFVINLPRVDNDWEIRLTLLSPDNDPKRTIRMTWESFQMVTKEPKAYDNLAVVRGLGQASDQFQGIPSFSGVYAAKIIKVPSNYDPVTRYYDGVWDGTFKDAHTDNPAWILYDLLTNDLYGFRRYYPNLLVDRFSFYDAAKWCDEFVPRPGGGFQPRWTYNDRIDQKRNAIELVYQLAGMFGAVPTSDFNGTIRLKIDKPETPVQIFGPESVSVEGFSYQFTAIEQRLNDVTVRFTNPNLDWEEDVRRVFNQDWIDANGRINEEMVALGCNDVFEAQRRGFRRILQANTETTTVTFKTARAGIALEVFDVIGIIDPTMNWGVSGRIKSKSENRIQLRDSLFLPVATNLTMTLQTPEGPRGVVVQAKQPNTKELELKSGSWHLEDVKDPASNNGDDWVISFTFPANDPEALTNIIDGYGSNLSIVDDPTYGPVLQGTDTYRVISERFGRPILPGQRLRISYDMRMVTQVDPSRRQFVFFTTHNESGSYRGYKIINWWRNPSVSEGWVTRSVEFEITPGVNGVAADASEWRIMLGVNGWNNPATAVGETQQFKNFKVEVLSDIEGQWPENLPAQAQFAISSQEVGLVKPFRILSIEEDTSQSDLLQITALEQNINKYGDIDNLTSSGTVTYGFEGSAFPSPPVITNVESGTDHLYINSDGKVTSRILVEWAQDPRSFTTQFRLFYRRRGRDRFRRVDVEGRQAYIDNVKDGEEYEIYMHALNAAGKAGKKTDTIVHTVIGKTEPPSNVQNAVAVQVGPDVRVTFDPVDDLDLAYYEVRQGTDWGTAAVVGTTTTTTLIDRNVRVSPATYLVKAFDTTGNESVTPASVVHNVPAPSQPQATFSFDRERYVIRVTPNAGDEVPIEEYRLEVNGNLIQEARSSTLTGTVDWEGPRNFDVIVRNTAGIESTARRVVGTVSAPAAIVANWFITELNYYISWTAPTASLPIEYYRVEDVSTGAILSARQTSTIFSGEVDWLGDREFRVVAVDTAGNESTPTIVTVQITEPDVSGLISSVSRSVLKLSWSGVRQSLPIRSYRVSRGASFAASTLLAVIDAETYSFNVDWNGSETFYVVAVDAAGNESAPASIVENIDPPSIPTLSAEVVDQNVHLVWDDATTELVLDRYILARQLPGDATPSDFMSVRATAVTIPATFLGTGQFFVRGVDEAGNEGQSGQASLVVSAPGSFTFAAEISDQFVLMSWDTPSATLPISHYEVRRGSSFGLSTLVTRLSGNSYSMPVDWSNTEAFYVVAVDTAGNASLPQTVEVDVTPPSQPAPRSEVIDNNVLLRWSNGSGTLPVVSTEIRKGETWATAELQQVVDATFASFFEFQAGDYTYWLANIDTAGNIGTPIPITTVVNEPPDFVLQQALTSDFSGTKSNLIVDEQGRLILGRDPSITYEEQFLGNGFASPQDQIDAGFPIYIQPTNPGLGSFYQEEIDLQVVISSSIINITPTVQILAGDPSVQVDIEVRETTSAPWQLFSNQTRAYAQNFRYVRFTVRYAGDDPGDLLVLSRIDVRLNVKLRNDAGSGTANAGDAGGTPVNFNVNFVDVASITVTPNTSTASVAVYDFEDTQNPTGFTVFLFDMNGTRISGDFSWAVRGY